VENSHTHSTPVAIITATFAKALLYFLLNSKILAKLGFQYAQGVQAMWIYDGSDL
jgi:hypothetical protein